jgi:hypothetical protein
MMGAFEDVFVGDCMLGEGGDTYPVGKVVAKRNRKLGRITVIPHLLSFSTQIYHLA